MLQDIPMDLVIFADSYSHWYQLPFSKAIKQQAHWCSETVDICIRFYSQRSTAAIIAAPSASFRIRPYASLFNTVCVSSFLPIDQQPGSVWCGILWATQVLRTVPAPLAGSQEPWRIHRFFVNIPNKRPKPFFSVIMITQHGDYVEHGRFACDKVPSSKGKTSSSGHWNVYGMGHQGLANQWQGTKHHCLYS